MRYKGYKIPTYEEALELMELNKLNDVLQYRDKLVVDAREVNIIVCTMEEADKIKQMDGINGINKKIEDVMKEYIDHQATAAIAAIDAVKDMEDSVHDDPNKTFHNKFSDNPVVSAQPDFKEDNKLTDEQIEKISEAAEKVVENNKNLQTIKDLPSNNGVDERKPEDITEEGDSKVMNVRVDPNTGEQQVIGTDELDDESFEDMYERISNSDIEFDQKTEITAEEASRITEMDKKELFSTSGIDDMDTVSKETIIELINLANRRIKKEEFSPYNEMPQQIKDLIDTYCQSPQLGISILDTRYKEVRRTVADMLLDDFISNISMERIKHDFNSELETMFSKASEEIGEDIVGYSENKINKYREAADKMEDPEKKEKLLKVLDRIQEAYDLTELKEFAKTCRIKKFDLEKTSKHFDAYTRKYADSDYNIYDINMARPILYRNLNSGDTEEYRDIDIDAFFIAFCKQTLTYKAENVLDHAYMYYVIYNIILSDINKSEKTREVSDIFLNNVKEVIENLRNRNKNLSDKED